MKLIKDLIEEIKAGGDLDEKLERLIKEDAAKSSMYAEKWDLIPFLEGYYLAKIRQMAAFLLAMPNVAEYHEVNKEDDQDGYKGKFLVAMKWLDDGSGTDLGTFINHPRTAETMFMVWWGAEDDLKYIVNTVNRRYKTEAKKTQEFFKIIKKLVGDGNVRPIRGGSENKQQEKS